MRHPNMATYTVYKFLIFIFKVLSYIVYKMTNTLFNMYNRQQALKSWQPIPNIDLTDEQVMYYNHKIQTMEENIPWCNMKYPGGLIDEEGLNETQIDANYVKYIALKYMSNLINYIKNKGIQFDNIEYNIRQIINEILTRQVDESYYINTIDIYEGINGTFLDTDIYDLIDQAIRLDNKRMLYYLILKEDEEMADRLSEIIKK